LNCRQSTKAEPEEKRRGNKSESDPGNNTGNSIDALLHSLFHYLLATKTKAKAALCEKRKRGRSEKKNAFFIDERRETLSFASRSEWFALHFALLYAILFATFYDRP
jgi:hypothetical protein